MRNGTKLIKQSEQSLTIYKAKRIRNNIYKTK
jgi:hypothetical protein